MKGFKVLALVLLITIGLSGCATFWPTGALYTEVKGPIAVGNDGFSYSKVGTAKATSILGLVATGDASIKTAMEDGKITKVKYVDFHVKNILGIYGEYATTVYGD